MTDGSNHVILICSRCRGEDHATALAKTLARRLPAGVSIRSVACMAGCDRPTTVGFQAVGKAHYLFGDITAPADLEALSAFAYQYQSSADGWTNATERPQALLHKTLSRMPAMCSETES